MSIHVQFLCNSCVNHVPGTMNYVCVIHFAIHFTLRFITWFILWFTSQFPSQFTDSILSVTPWFGIWFVVLSRLSYRQDKRMDELNLFIDYHYKSIVSIIWTRHVITLHLSHTNWRKLKLSLYWQLQECSCMLCNFYQIESYQTYSNCNPLSM